MTMKSEHLVGTVSELFMLQIVLFDMLIESGVDRAVVYDRLSRLAAGTSELPLAGQAIDALKKLEERSARGRTGSWLRDVIKGGKPDQEPADG